MECELPPADQMLNTHGVILTEPRDSILIYTHLWNHPDLLLADTREWGLRYTQDVQLTAFVYQRKGPGKVRTLGYVDLARRPEPARWLVARLNGLVYFRFVPTGGDRMRAWMPRPGRLPN